MTFFYYLRDHNYFLIFIPINLFVTKMTSHSEHYFQFYVDKKEESLSKHYNDSYASKTSRSQYSSR